MECSICFEAITEGTGKIVLPCDHPFHIKCMTKWANATDTQTCPMCRHESLGDAMVAKKENSPIIEDSDSDADDGGMWSTDVLRGLELRVMGAERRERDALDRENVAIKEKNTATLSCIFVMSFMLGMMLYIKHRDTTPYSIPLQNLSTLCFAV